MKQEIITIMLALICLVGQAQVKNIVWEQPCTEENSMIEGYFSTLLEITRVEFAKDETRVFMHVANQPDNWVKFAASTHLVADGKTYALKHLEGMELDKEVHLTDHGYTDVVFHFEPLPEGTQCFDFTGGNSDGTFKLLGIEDAKTRALKMFPSNWRNVQTGDWEISFYDECAIYDCKFWNYKQREQKGDKYTIVMENGGKEINVNIDKNKRGNRFITINGKKGEYNLISSITMPDYPTKDTRTAFKDTNYKTDTVTLVGWLKDMPENMKNKGNEYKVLVYDDIIYDNSNVSYGKMDDKGRFVMKIPILNSSEVFFDWDRTYIRTLFEPGETYFMLYDFKGGHKMFMGKNCRLQNETLAQPISWAFRFVSEKMNNTDKEKALAFMQGLKDDKADALNELKKVIAARPNVSDRYINYLKGYYDMAVYHNFMPVRFYMKNRQVPAEIMDYANQYWQQLPRPYTLYRDFRNFKTNYVGQLVEGRYYTWVGSRLTTPDCKIYSYILKKNREEGKVKITDDELAIVEQYADEFSKHNINTSIDEETKKAHEEFFNSSLCKQFDAIFEREDIKKALTEEKPVYEVYRILSIMDSVGGDQDLRDILIVNELGNILLGKRKPLSDHVMQFLEENVKMPAAKTLLRAQQESYLALQRRDIPKSPSLKSAEDVANMSDGEQMLRKLIEPYKGKIILLDIWGTWCGPCKAALVNSQKEYKRLKDYNIVYLYLANDSPDEAWKNIIKEYKVTGENVVHYNLHKAQQSAIEHFIGVTGFPTYKLIDRDGNILDVNADPRDLEGLARLLEQMK